MTIWTIDAVRRAAADWVWMPDGTRTAGTDLRLIDYPDWVAAGMQAMRIRSDRPAAEIIDEAADQARTWQRNRINWWVNDATRPADLEATLIDRGAALDETVAILAADLTAPLPPLPDAPGVTAEPVVTRQQYLDADVVNVRVWGQEPITPERLDAQLAEQPSSDDLRVLARLEGEPVSTGGCTIVDGVARLWGAATLESARHRGAYRAVLALRLELARQAGATLALVKGRADTSAPILQRAGFRHYGEDRILAHHL